MEAFTELTNVDFSSLFISVFAVLIGIKAIASLFEWGIEKLGLETKGMRRKREDHELLVKTSQSLLELQERHTKDIEQSITHEIEALMCGCKELLGAEIDKRYREYIALKGIPESEVNEFDDIFAAYKGLNGNHSRDTKYNYVKNHLTVIPVETKLVINKENN